jgi:hypothetical protein
MNETNVVTTKASARRAGPNPGIVAAVFTALFLASLVPVTLMVSKVHFPSPLQPTEEILIYFQAGAETNKILWCAFLQFGSAMGDAL